MNTPRLHRNDIDGLRALAVLLVVLYHLRVAGFGGGFVGVDVFFVISGFVVTRMLSPAIATSVFSFRQFYLSRFWRLQPAFFLMCAVTLAACHWVLDAADLWRAARSVAAASTMSANFYFWRATQGYDSPLAELEPLLHCWSLAVEEQFYLLWPLLLVLGAKLRWVRGTAWWVGLLLALVGLSQYLAVKHPSMAFYLLPARLMELGIGAALVRTESHVLSHRASLALSWVGVALILGSAVGLDASRAFPGFRALLPCLGTAALIQGGTTRTLVSRLFDNRGASLLGKASYSLYLLHWPPIALANYAGVELTPTVQAALLMGSLTLSLLTYRFWETPTRRAATRPYRVATYGIVFGVALAVAAIVRPGSAAQLAHVAQKANRKTDAADKRFECLFRAKDWPAIDACGKVTARPGNKRMLIWGDSHAEVWGDAVLKSAEALGITPTVVKVSGCPPLFGIHLDANSMEVSKCDEALGEQLKTFLSEHTFDFILMIGRFGIYETGWVHNGKLHRETHFVSDAQTESANAKDSAKVFHRNLLQTVRLLVRNRATRVIFALPTPVMPKTVERDKRHEVRLLRKDHEAQLSPLRRVAQDFPSAVRVLDETSAVCGKDVCPAWEGNTALFIDDNHMSPEGAARLIPMLKSTLMNDNHR